MDPLTQGALGAALAQAPAKRHETRLAAVAGAAAGMAADLDVLISSSADPLLTLEFHRHFTHSLFFVPLGALLVAGVLWPLMRRRLGFFRLYLFTFMGYSLSGVLDAFTSYGTHLLWPLSDARISWNLIAVVDPVFTLGLMTAVVYAAVKRAPRAAWMGLGFAALYLGLAWSQSQRAESAARALAEERGHSPERMLVKPTLGNLVVWRSVYETEGRYHVDALRIGFGPDQVFPGGSVPRLDVETLESSLGGDSVSYRDLLRFRGFSDGYLALHPRHSEVVGDVRYSMQPDGLTPLWGVEFDPDHPGSHVRERVFRESSPSDRRRFLELLLGKPVPVPSRDGH